MKEISKRELRRIKYVGAMEMMLPNLYSMLYHPKCLPDYSPVAAPPPPFESSYQYVRGRTCPLT